MPRPLHMLIGKGKDCESVGGFHEWYNLDNRLSACYHCKQVREGRLWVASGASQSKEESVSIADNH